MTAAEWTRIFPVLGLLPVVGGKFALGASRSRPGAAHLFRRHCPTDRQFPRDQSSGVATAGTRPRQRLHSQLASAVAILAGRRHATDQSPMRQDGYASGGVELF
jgi:hypothetical protein